jgi:hypothetical protein
MQYLAWCLLGLLYAVIFFSLIADNYCGPRKKLPRERGRPTRLPKSWLRQCLKKKLIFYLSLNKKKTYTTIRRIYLLCPDPEIAFLKYIVIIIILELANYFFYFFQPKLHKKPKFHEFLFTKTYEFCYSTVKKHEKPPSVTLIS